MKHIVIALVVVVLSATAPAWGQGSPSPGETAIREIIRAQEDGWNRGNAKDYAASFQSEGVFTIIVGTTYRTREMLAERVGQILATIFKGSVLSHSIRAITFVRPDVALVDIGTEMTGFAGLPPGVGASSDGRLRTTMLQVMVNDGKEWRVAAFHNVDRSVP